MEPTGFSNLQELLDLFTRDQYPPNEKNISVVPFDDVFNQLNIMFSEGYSYEVTHTGLLADGKNYVVVKLTVNMLNGPVTRPGAAEGNIGMSGLIGVALKNAALRHFGMGQGLYQYEDGQEPIFDNSGYGTTQPVASAPAGVPYGNPNHVNTTPNQSNGRQPFKPWDGAVVIKSGKYIGQTWSAMDPNDLQALVVKGNNLAILENDRRMKTGGLPKSPFTR